MPTLRDLLLVLQRNDIRPSEITLSSELFRYFIQQVREIINEEGEEDEETELIDNISME